MFFAFLINVLAVAINVFIGMTYGFTDLTVVCIGVNVVIGLACLLAAMVWEY